MYHDQQPWWNGDVRPRVAVISIHAAPYQDPMLASVHQRGIVDLQVLTLFERDRGHAAWDIDQPAYPNTFLGKGYRVRENVYYHPRILSLLQHGRFDVLVIPGYNHITAQVAYIYGQRTRTPVIFNADTVSHTGGSAINKQAKKQLFRAILKYSAAAWVPGKAAADWIARCGLARDRIFEGAYTLDGDAISKALEQASTLRTTARQQLGIGENSFVFIMVGNLVPKRQHSFLIRAFARVGALHPDCFLILVGSGPEHDRLQQLCRQLSCNKVRFIDQAPFRQLAGWYALSDAYVHTGSEAYSTALSYAAMAGRAVISTPEVGAAHDYVRHEVTGYVVAPDHVDDLANRMGFLVAHPEVAQVMGQQIRDVAQTRGVFWAARQFEAAVSRACDSRVVRTEIG